MKYFKTAYGSLLLLLMWGLPTPGMAQQPTKKEMEEMLKQMKADTALQKAMKQAGVDPSMVEKQAQNLRSTGRGSYYEIDEFQTPQKDQARISALPKKPLTKALLPAYLRVIQQSIGKGMSESDRKVISFLDEKSKNFPADSLAFMGSGTWMAGHYLAGIYYTGRACQQDPNPNNLNNYAAFLLMLGGEDLALPILQKINREVPQNSTILNNIGQAWFGLGDLDKANQYLDSALRIYPAHPQANITKCVIQVSRGDRSGALESLKRSIQEGYSATKEAMLRKLGYKLSGKDLVQHFPIPPDPLGFNQWIAKIPPFPKSYQEQMLYAPLWRELYAQADGALGTLEKRSQELNVAYAKFEKEKLAQYQSDPYGSAFAPPYLADQAGKVMKYYGDSKGGFMAGQVKELANQISDLEIFIQSKRAIYDKRVKELRKKGDEQAGEGKGSGPDICPDMLAAFNLFIGQTNSAREAVFLSELNYEKEVLEATAYLNQFTTDNKAMIAFVETNNKIKFLQRLNSYYDMLKPDLDYSEVSSCLLAKKDTSLKDSLTNWDSLHCDKNVEFYVPLTGVMRFTCNTREFHLNPLLLPFEWNRKENSNTNEVMMQSGALSFKKEIAGIKVGIKLGGGYDYTTQKGYGEISAGTKVAEGELGNVPAKINANTSVNLEFDKNGVSDVTVKVTGDAKTDIKYGDGKGVDIPTGKVEAGAQWSWSAGPSATGKAAFQQSIQQAGPAIQNLMK